MAGRWWRQQIPPRWPGPAGTAIAALAAADLALSSCGLGGPTLSPFPTQDATSVPERVSSSEMKGVGEAVAAEGVTLTVDEVTQTSTLKWGGTRSTIKPPSGDRFVLVHATIENTGDEDIAPVCGDIDASLDAVDAGTEISAETIADRASYPPNPTCDATTEAGADDVATFIFAVAADARPTAFR